MITRQDFYTLLEGAGDGSHKATRDVAIGVFVSCLIGIIGLLTMAPDLATAGLKGRLLLFTLVLGAATLASLALAVYHHFLSSKEKDRRSFSHCVERIEAGLPPEEGEDRAA